MSLRPSRSETGVECDGLMVRAPRLRTTIGPEPVPPLRNWAAPKRDSCVNSLMRRPSSMTTEPHNDFVKAVRDLGCEDDAEVFDKTAARNLINQGHRSSPKSWLHPCRHAVRYAVSGRHQTGT